MSSVLAELKHKAALLSESDRAELALSLIESLDQELHLDAEEAWRVELARRVEQIERGDVDLVAGDEVFARIRRSLE